MACCTSNGFINTGRGNATKFLQTPSILIFTALRGSDNSLNKVNKADTFNDEYMFGTGGGTGVLNAPDKLDRWFPVRTFKNNDMPQADDITKDYSDQVSIILKSGIYSFAGELPGVAPQYAKVLKSFGCGQVGVYGIDDCGNFIATKTNSDNDNIYPIPLEDGTLTARYMPKSLVGGVTGKLMLGFQFSKLIRSEDFYVVSKDNFFPTYDFLAIGFDGNINLKAAITVNSATEIETKLTTDYANNFEPDEVLAEGWVLADFTIFNDDTGLEVVPSAVVEAPAGTYTSTFLAQTTGDVGQLSGYKNQKQLDETEFIFA